MSQCKNCQMQNQNPGTDCSHCGRAIPELQPTTLTLPAEESAEVEDAQGQPESVSEGTQEAEVEASETQAPEAEEVVPESGHVDNVGDDSETETVVP